MRNKKIKIEGSEPIATSTVAEQPEVGSGMGTKISRLDYRRLVVVVVATFIRKNVSTCSVRYVRLGIDFLLGFKIKVTHQKHE